MDQLKYDSLYSGLVSINKSLGGTQSMPDSEYGAMIDLMDTLSGQPVGESGDAYDAVSTVATMAENGELPIQAPKLDSVNVDITANGRYDYQPSAYGLDGFSGFVANVNVPTSGGGTKIDVGGLGLKFGSSTFSTVPDVFDFSKVTDMSFMFNDCSKLTTIPQFDTSRVTNMSYMFNQCINLQSIPLLNTSNVTDMSFMFRDCALLTNVPQLDTSSVTNMEWMFMDCELLTTVPLFNTSNVTNMSDMFKFCTNLTTIPQFNTSNVTDVSNMFYSCPALESIPELDFGNVGTMGLFLGRSNLPNLTTIGGFRNIKAWFDIQSAPNLTVQSLMNIINNLYDFIGNGESTTSSIRMGETNLAKLTDEQKAVATNKGWELK